MLVLVGAVLRPDMSSLMLVARVGAGQSKFPLVAKDGGVKSDVLTETQFESF